MCGQRRRSEKCFCFQLFFSAEWGDVTVLTSWAPFVSACRPLPPSSLEGRLARRATARQCFNAEVGHRLPPPRNDSPGDPRPADRRHSSIPSSRTSISMFDRNIHSDWPVRDGVFFLSLPWLVNGLIIVDILFESGADYLYCANVLFFYSFEAKTLDKMGRTKWLCNI